MQRFNRAFHLSEAERHYKARVLAMVSDALDQAYAEQGRKHTVVEEWLDGKLQVCCTARQTDRGLEIELVVSYLRLDRGGPA